MNLSISVKTNYKIYKHKYRYYMRTRDVASILGVKQQYEFNRNIKQEFMDDKIILKGKSTEPFRTEDDCERTTFINVSDLILFLEAGNINHKFNIDKRNFLITYLKNLV